ncbi:TetR family transcriptional regulator [Nonomuraea sp. NPDC005501]|uniref:TetR/AcrR family transcriptional regulator n=1 Tax=Nonomuraea sp. NPDC005501 TaxID=3156884 RepID=UPI0033BEE095
MTARRDPVERRRRMVQAACELIPEVGVNGLTHRLVAARAGVPLGATTYYFASLGDLVAAALAHAAEATEEWLRVWGEELRSSADVPATLAALTAAYLRERDRMVIWNELYAAAAHRPELRPLARLWIDGLTAVLAGRADARAARAAAMFVDGALLHCLIDDEPLDAGWLERSLAALLGMGPG